MKGSKTDGKVIVQDPVSAETQQGVLQLTASGRQEPHRPDVIELPVEHAHGLSIGLALQAPPVGDGHIIRMRLLHLGQICPQLVQPASRFVIHEYGCRSHTERRRAGRAPCR